MKTKALGTSRSPKWTTDKPIQRPTRCFAFANTYDIALATRGAD